MKPLRLVPPSVFWTNVREDLVKNRIKKVLDRASIKWEMPSAGIFAKAGVSDFLCWAPAEPFAVPFGIEAKGLRESGKRGTTTPKQDEWGVEMTEANVPWLLIDDRNIVLLPLLLQAEGIPYHVQYNPEAQRRSRPRR